MGAITVFRAMAWFGMVVIFWSLNVRWGTDTGVGSGPPILLWERLVVAAGMLALFAALTLSVSGRKGNPPSWTARGIAGAAAVLIAVIALYMRSSATGILEDAGRGPGWLWLVAGGGMVLGGVLASMGLKTPVKKGKQRRKRRK